jgi:hypothetical protein
VLAKLEANLLERKGGTLLFDEAPYSLDSVVQAGVHRCEQALAHREPDPGAEQTQRERQEGEIPERESDADRESSQRASSSRRQ